MKFGIANAIRNHPAKSYSITEVYKDYVDDARLAEELGFSFSWYGEHRMTPCQWTPSPLTVCAWVAAKTKTMRVGPQVLCLPFHNPLRDTAIHMLHCHSQQPTDKDGIVIWRLRRHFVLPT